MRVVAELHFRAQPDGTGQAHRELVLDGISQIGREECNLDAAGALERVDPAAWTGGFCGHCTTGRARYGDPELDGVTVRTPMANLQQG